MWLGVHNWLINEFHVKESKLCLTAFKLNPMFLINRLLCYKKKIIFFLCDTVVGDYTTKTTFYLSFYS